MRSQPPPRPPRPRRPKSALEQSGLEPQAEELSPREKQERLLNRMTEGAKLCQEIQTLLGHGPGPELETIIQLHRVLVLKLSAEAQAQPELLGLVNLLMKPLMDWARLEESRKQRELAEQKRKEKEQRGRGKALSPETLQKIERELRLF